jgi:hypothetical protein
MFGPLKTYLAQDCGNAMKAQASSVLKHEWVKANQYAHPLTKHPTQVARDFDIQV